MKKKVVIIGAGISGLTAGIYLLDNGFDVEIYEKHTLPGGECTGWYRDKTFIDGCAHWIIGVNPKSDLYPSYKHIHLIEDNSKIFLVMNFSDFWMNDHKISFYSDLNKLNEVLRKKYPEDKKMIRRLINGIKAYQHVKIPVKKPLDKMNIFELTAFGLKMLPMVPHLIKYKRMSIGYFANKFKSTELRNILPRIMTKKYNVHSLLYVLQALTLNDAGVIEGGSLKMALRIAKHFQANGGKLFLNKPVKKINIEGKIATGITLENNDEIKADYIISSCDINFTLDKLLDNTHVPTYYKNARVDLKNYPLITGFLFSFKVDKDVNLDSIPTMSDFNLYNPIDICGDQIKSIAIRNFAFDKTLSKNGETLITSLTPPLKDFVYEKLKAMDFDSYITYKNSIGEQYRVMISKLIKIPLDKIKLIDVATPLTYEYYLNAYRGSYMSYLTTRKSKGLMNKGIIKGVNNLFLSGQWLMSPGGIPIAVFTGKHAAYRVTTADKKRFKDLD